MTYDLNITFDDNLVTGNETIDTQHKELIDRIQNLSLIHISAQILMVENKTV